MNKLTIDNWQAVAGNCLQKLAVKLPEFAFLIRADRDSLACLIARSTKAKKKSKRRSEEIRLTLRYWKTQREYQKNIETELEASGCGLSKSELDTLKGLSRQSLDWQLIELYDDVRSRSDGIFIGRMSATKFSVAIFERAMQAMFSSGLVAWAGRYEVILPGSDETRPIEGLPRLNPPSEISEDVDE